MSNPTSVPDLHKFLKERHKEVSDRLNKNIMTLFESPAVRIDLIAVQILRDRIEMEVLTAASEALFRQQSATNAASPVRRVRNLKGNLQDRLFGSLSVQGSLQMLAIEAHKQKVLTELIGIVDGTVRDMEKAE